ncbi:MAG: hypothetical protein H0T76_04255 [Nannocystis sp.]|nr:hypothetical protein [Nannocystis sp.]MBA3545674.1 hypothetical protein [Nannocystis sp.]
MTLGPGPGTPGSCVLQSAGPVTVNVQVADAAEVWMTVDDGEPVALEPVGDEGAEFVGEIAVLGESWNGKHTVSAIAKNGELVSAPWPDTFTVAAPPGGSEAWLDKSVLTPSYGNAVAVDAQGDVFELFTYSGNQGGRCMIRRRDALGMVLWADDARPIAANVTCEGEDLKVAPDGTLWVLVDTYVQNAWRWELWHVDAEGTPLGPKPQIGSPKHRGAGLDVSTAGEVLVCGTRPGSFGTDDTWVRYQPAVGDGWTVPWVFKQIANVEADERARDCAFVEDRIVVAGEAFGKTVQNDIDSYARGFVLELGRDSTKMAETITTTGPGWQSGHEAVVRDGSGGYVTVGYSCDSKAVPCAPTQGVVRWFSLGGTEIWTEPVKLTQRIVDVVLSPGDYVVVAAQATKQTTGILVQAWKAGKGTPLWEYQGAQSAMQVASGVAVGPYAVVYGVGFYLEANNVLASGVVKLHPL